MYEMEGASSGFTMPGRPVARLTRRSVPPASTQYPHEVPVSQLLPRSEVGLGWFPRPTVKYFYCVRRR
jgi:hypothetical protein